MICRLKQLYSYLLSEMFDGVLTEFLCNATNTQFPPGTEFYSLTIQETLNVTGLVDGVSVEEMLDQRIPLKGDCTIQSLFVFNDTVSAGKSSL